MNRKTSRLGGALVVSLAVAWALCRSGRSQYSFRGRTVVVTGGSRGLGLVISRRLAAEGANVVLLARNERELQLAEAELSSAGGVVASFRCDIRKRDQVEHTIQRVVERFSRVDILINNAGIIQVGPLEHMTYQDFEEAMAVHFYGPLHAILAVLPHMRRSGGGRIVNVTSIGGKVGVPHLIPYCASKFALVGLSDSMRAELRQENILVTTVVPGLMRTGSPPNAQFKGQHKQEYAWFALMDSLPGVSMNAERAAMQIVEACRRGAAQLTIGAHTKAAVLLNEMCPGASARVSSLVNQLLPGPDPSGSKETHSGWDSQSRLAPSWLTRLSDQATLKNNETPAHG